MKLTRIEIENFKAIGKRVSVPIRPITLLFGPNSAGKSTVMHALHYLYEILVHKNLDAGRPVLARESLSFGGFLNSIHLHDPYRQMKFKIDFDVEDFEFIDVSDRLLRHHSLEFEFHRNKTIENVSVEITVSYDHNAKKPYVSSYEVSLNGSRLGTVVATSGGRDVALNQLNLDHPQIQQLDFEGELCKLDYFACEDETSNRFGLRGLADALPDFGRGLDIEWPSWFETYIAVYRPAFQDLLSCLIVTPGILLRAYLAKFRYLGPIRKQPDRTFQPRRRVNNGRWELGLAAWDLLYLGGKSTVTTVSSWLSSADKLNTGYSLKLEDIVEVDVDAEELKSFQKEGTVENAQAMLKYLGSLKPRKKLSIIEERSNIALHASDIGIGISQLLPVVVAAVDLTSGIVGIEQPELHTHPGLQVSLGDLFIEFMSEDRPFLLETHSEHLLLRLLKRIRQKVDGSIPDDKKGLDPEDLSIIFVERVGEELRMKLKSIGRDGEFKERWPTGFFEERLAELR